MNTFIRILTALGILLLAMDAYAHEPTGLICPNSDRSVHQCEPSSADTQGFFDPN